MRKRQKSPAAPSLSLGEALDGMAQLAEVHGDGDIDVLDAAEAIGLGHTNAKARRVLASLRMYGLLKTAGIGKVEITDTCRRLLETHDARTVHALRAACVRRPQVFAKLLMIFPAIGPSELPCDDTLRRQLTEMGFRDQQARSVIECLRHSLAFAAPDFAPSPPAPDERAAAKRPIPQRSEVYDMSIPVRLSGQRQAWLLLPKLFYESDKEMLLAQVRLEVTDDEPELTSSPGEPTGSP